jgi:hypothetical protein
MPDGLNILVRYNYLGITGLKSVEVSTTGYTEFIVHRDESHFAACGFQSFVKINHPDGLIVVGTEIPAIVCDIGQACPDGVVGMELFAVVANVREMPIERG